ncbi:MAG: HEPN domain-containing protein [Phycisphaeraceae bacterium]|nr:MAG: HEPN domain-containing protein [Phycisphaeraceae bacterium]
MSGRPEQLDETVRRWLAVAADDLRVARHTLEMPDPPYWLVAYHLQQAAEKSLKAVLIGHGIAFPLTHDIGLLLDLCGEHLPESRGWSGAVRLTNYGTQARYPGVAEKVGKSEVEEAVGIATEIVETVASRLGQE